MYCLRSPVTTLNLGSSVFNQTTHYKDYSTIMNLEVVLIFKCNMCLMDCRIEEGEISSYYKSVCGISYGFDFQSYTRDVTEVVLSEPKSEFF